MPPVENHSRAATWRQRLPQLDSESTKPRSKKIAAWPEGSISYWLPPRYLANRLTINHFYRINHCSGIQTPGDNLAISKPLHRHCPRQHTDHFDHRNSNSSQPVLRRKQKEKRKERFSSICIFFRWFFITHEKTNIIIDSKFSRQQWNGNIKSDYWKINDKKENQEKSLEDRLIESNGMSTPLGWLCVDVRESHSLYIHIFCCFLGLFFVHSLIEF